MNQLDAIVLAGGLLEPADPLFGEAPDARRCLIPIAGRSMVQWVVDVLSESENVNAIYIMGLPPDSGLFSNKPLYFISDAGGIFENIHSGVMRSAADHPTQEKVIIASGDLPAVSTQMVDWLIAWVADHPDEDLYYNVISQAVMEARFPEAGRSYVHFRDIAVCGGDLNIIDHRLFSQARPLWKKLAEARKNPLKQASLLGWDSLILVALRLVTLEGAVRRVCKRLAIRGKAILNPFAEMAMDADKPHQLAILRADLERRV